MNDKQTHFGRAGEYFAMSELLLRGWNVAVPVVDVGDDVFVINDNDKTTLRVQVKSCLAKQDGVKSEIAASFTISRAQLWGAQLIELIYILMIRIESHWTFMVLPRERLHEIHENYLIESREPRKGGGRPPKTNKDAKTDSLTLTLKISAATGKAWIGWGISFEEFVGTWPDQLLELPEGPGSKRIVKSKVEE